MVGLLRDVATHSKCWFWGKAPSSGLFALFLCAVAFRESLPPNVDVFWATAAGISGAVGIAALYRALSIGNAAVVAPIAAVIGAVEPVLFGLLAESLPI
ncbi:MAG: hypothetical protein MAG451_01938 [Anaerolineales bacterium]|nr:hypothetical protein [Anaerolineales bacterium]